MKNASRGQMRASDLMEVKSLMILSYCVGARNRNRSSGRATAALKRLSMFLAPCLLKFKSHHLIIAIC